MLLHLPTGKVPEVPQSQRFVLELQSLNHNQADYAAVMSSKEHLRRWSFSDWPEDTFSPQQNMDDLREHLKDAREGLAYGYTVFSPGRTEVWGSLYLNPIGLFQKYYRLDESAQETFSHAQVEVDYWLRDVLEADEELHREFVQTVQHWLLLSWGYKMPLWGSRHSLPERHAFFSVLGMQEVMRLSSIYSPARSMLFHQGPPL